jgi:2-dehydro-3-deoxyphosphogluconate aldolase/(4S)-4-hydroxy-2-oxoglutarate aldolase
VDISAIANLAPVVALPDAVIGAGTVLQPRQFEDVRRAGDRFAVGPGCTPTLVTAARAAGLPFLPGIQTVSEAMVLAEQGFGLLKFFPADAAGGLAWLKAVGSPPQPPDSNGSSVATGKMLQRQLGSSTCLDE